MVVKIIDNTPKIKNEVNKGSIIAIRNMARDVVKIANPKTPSNTTQLRQSVKITQMGKNIQIQWKAKYAIFQEEKQYKHYTTAGTGPHFARNAVEQVQRDSEKYFRGILR